MTSIDLSQDELKVIVTLILQLRLTLPDASIVLPIMTKLQKEIIPDPPKEEKKEEVKENNVEKITA